MKQDVADGYRYVICIRCTNGVSEGTINNVHLCQCEDIDNPQISEFETDGVLILPYEAGGAYYGVYDVHALYDMVQDFCTIDLCELKESDCSTAHIDNEIGFYFDSGAVEVTMTYAKSVVAGYRQTLCL
jgi:hypothetical protein